MTAGWIQKPEILSRIPLDRHAVIEASAGTGKTFTLEHLIIELVLSGVRIESILVVTFTEKATAELRARVRSKLGEVLFAEAKPLPEGADEKAYWKIDPAARQLLRDALLRFDAATVSTIHAFCQKILTEHAFLNQRLFGETQVDERHAFGAAYKESLRRELAWRAPLSWYLKAYLSKGETIDELGELLFKCHNARTKYLRPAFEHDAMAEALAAFPLGRIDQNAAAMELRALKGRAVSGEVLRDRIGIALPLIAAGQDRDPAWFLAEAAEQDEKKPTFSFLAEKADDLAAAGPACALVAQAIRPLGKLIVPLEAAVVSLFLPLVERCLERDKRQRGVFDFEDMLLLLDKALSGAHESELLLAALRDRYRVALIDEYQDTDPVQWRIFRKVFYEGPQQRLYVIGDPKQAIYAFRGADVHTYLKARDEIEQVGKIVSLTENFRSSHDLITAYNRIFDQAANPPFFTGRIRYDAPVVCGRPGLDFTDGDGNTLAPIKVWQVAAADGENLNAADVHRAFLTKMVTEIRWLLDPERGPLFGEKGAMKPIKPGDIHVLTRSKLDGLRVGEVFRRNGIPHAFFKQEGLFQSREAREIRDLLLGIDNPSNVSRRLRAWLTSFFSLQLEELGELEEVPAAHPLMRRLYEWKALADAKEYTRLFTRIIEDSGITRRELFFGDNERALTNYLHLFELLLESAGRRPPTLAELVGHLDALIEGREQPVGENGNVQRLESERDAVQIMTIHKSKGLEATVVFLYGGFRPAMGDKLPLVHHEDGKLVAELRPKKALLKTIKEAIEQEDREENQRLYYVALTRAKARLYLPYFAGAGWLNGDYALIDRRLQKVLAASAEEKPQLFDVEQVRYRRLELVKPEQETIERWEPPRELLADRGDDQELRELKKKHAGFIITSYSRMKAQARGEEADAADDVVGEIAIESQLELAPDELPTGTTTGVFIHEILEKAPLESFSAPDAETWRARPEIASLIAEALLQHNLDPRYTRHAARLAYSAFTTPIELGGVTLDGLARASKVVREMEFLYPMPERSREVERGYIKGFVDLVFEHKNRTFFGDWKSDLLPAWDRKTITDHVDRGYRLQIKLYSLAFVRLLGITDRAAYQERFGGFLYCFLRGMAHNGEGALYERPTWDEIQTWEEELIKGDVFRGRMFLRPLGKADQTRFSFFADPPAQGKKGRKR